VAAIWLGIVLAYDSFYWPPAGRGWPVSFFVVTLIVGGYLVTYLRPRLPPDRTTNRTASTRSRHVHRRDGQHLARATAVAVIAGVTGFFAVLRGSTFAAHAIPNGAFAGAAGASLLGLNPFAGLAAFSVAGALGHRWAQPALPARRGHRADLRDDARHRRAVRQLEQPVRAGGLLAAVRRGVRGQRRRGAAILALGAVSIVAIAVMFRPLMLSSALPEVAAARGLDTRRNRARVPARHGPGHQHDRAGGGRAADVQP